MISIHAPARGATGDAKDIWLAVRNFNPRSREGSDHKFISSASKMRYFNPRSREGSDLFSVIHLCSLQDFNPRSREGSDVYIPLWIHLQHISIHAPARGATPLENGQ